MLAEGKNPMSTILKAALFAAMAATLSACGSTEPEVEVEAPAVELEEEPTFSKF